METANLTKAHEHVRNAAAATYDKSVATAGTEHELAASAFHDAAKDTSNQEALRILARLEDYHANLARLIKEHPRKKESGSSPSTQGSDAPTSPPSTRTSGRTASPSSSPSSTRAPSRRRLPQSSIASNLAEKRGIPGARRGTPTAAPVSVTNALASRNERQSTPVRDLLEQQSRKAEASKQKEDGQKPTPAPREASPAPDMNFRNWYSTFGNVMNAISAPLAFTSLPLNPSTPSTSTPVKDTQTPAVPEPPPSKKAKPLSPSASTTIKASEPDLARLISGPALRALREDQSYPFGAPQESFYVVPTSGGTVSYANILRDPSHPHHAAQDPSLDAINEGNEGSGLGLRGSSHEEFVDARESLQPPSPTSTRRPRSKGSTSAGPAVTTTQNIRAGRGTGHKTMEELALENETLRALIDKQAKRLSMWETTSQSSYNALAQSFRARGRAEGLRQQLSDPSALAQALSQGSGAIPQPASPPPVPSIPSQYQSSSPQSTKPPPSDANLQQAKRIAELEALLASHTTTISELESEKQSLTRQNEKNGQVIGRYREQWEKLKAGARKKEQERRDRKLAEIREVKEEGGADSGREKDEDEVKAEGEVEGGESEIIEEGTFGKA